MNASKKYLLMSVLAVASGTVPLKVSIGAMKVVSIYLRLTLMFLFFSSFCSSFVIYTCSLSDSLSKHLRNVSMY
jgi:hypothetical protein